MLENLSYIYKAMYALDLYDSLNNFMNGTTLILCIILVISHMIAGLITIEVDGAWMKFWNATKFYQKFAIAIIILFSLIHAVTPSKNTVKAYIGVKAVQAVGEYLDKETDIPERSKATLTKLWDKVDSYIESIDTEPTPAPSDTSASKVESLKTQVTDKAGTDNVNALIEAVKQQAIDSVISTIKK